MESIIGQTLESAGLTVGLIKTIRYGDRRTVKYWDVETEWIAYQRYMKQSIKKTGIAPKVILFDETLF